ncbi:MAG: tRNA (N6-isopentenyl adenosine(37)-C2)-methylthiotransferase MiaB [Lachnospiraceae bacterium]|nr:tRNA (N6-isopentenyl adenosine(37)-C2)-methylthiotransferase MiaB [Lachnospiraceae bacterium]
MLDTARTMEEPPQQDGSLRQAWFINRARELVSRKEEELGRKLTSCVVTFGCQMNERDSEKLRGILKLAGYEESASEDADFVLYNTCTVRENANVRVYGRLGSLSAYRKKNPGMVIALCGCMMQEKDVVEKIRRDYRYVRLVFGTHNLHRFAELLVACLMSDSPVIDVVDRDDSIVENLPSERTYSFKSGVNIMFGCNNFCSYCIVPYVRGREKSREPKEIIREIEQLAADGVVEVMLLGQNVNSYGKGLGEDVTFARLLQDIEKIDGIERIRFMTSHPKDLSDDLIDVMAHSKKICHHLHLPVQSGSSRLLKIMNRHYTKESYLELVDRLRKAMPDLSLTTDIIVGFPGETEEDFLETMDIVRRVEYDSAFTFIYSRRTGTPAASMEDQISEEVIKDRFDRLLKEVQRLGRMRSSRFEGQVMPVLVEERNRQEEGYMTGRTPYNLVVHFPGDEGLTGRIVDVRLNEARVFYYMGERV